MFKLLKFVVWAAGILALSYLALRYFGYDVNREYFSNSRARCEKKLKECADLFISQGGTQDPKCEFICIDQKPIIKRK